MSNWKMVNTRQCGNCTKCCEGYLSANIRGEEVFFGKPCFLLQLGKGCSDYENRPIEPCKTFECEWLSDSNYPEEFYPHTAGFVVHKQIVEDIDFVRITCTGRIPNQIEIEWFLKYYSDRNVCWIDNTGEHWRGDTLFEDAMKRNYS